MLEDAIISDPEEAYDLDGVDWDLFKQGLSNDSIFVLLDFVEGQEAVNKIKYSLELVDSIAKYNYSDMIDSLRYQFPRFRRGYAAILVPKIKEAEEEEEFSGEDGEEDEDEDSDDEDEEEEVVAQAEEEQLDPKKEIKKLFDMIEAYKKGTNNQITSNFNNITTKANNFFLISLIIFVVLISVLLYFLKFFTAVANALKKLSNDANIIKDGNLEHKINADRTDEVGTLQLNFDLMREEVKDFIENLDKKVQERTREVQEEKKKIADLLNNMKQAVFKINSDGIVVGPVSEFTSDVFGEDIVGKNIFDNVYKDVVEGSETYASVNTCFIAVFGEDDLQWDLQEDNLPEKVTRIVEGYPNDKQILKINYAPLWNDMDELEEIMFVVEDVTELEALAEEKRKSEENIRMIQAIADAHMDDIRDFFKNTHTLLDDTKVLLDKKVYDQESFGLMFRYLHTVKGNSRVFNFNLVASTVHDVEHLVTQCLNKIKDGETIDENTIEVIYQGIADTAGSLDRYADVGLNVFKVNLDSSKGGSGGQQDTTETTKILNKNFKKLEDLVGGLNPDNIAGSYDQLKEVFHSLYEVDVKSSFAKYKSMINEVAQKLKKQIDFTVTGDDVSMNKEKLSLLHDAIIHMLRNSADHGIEEEEVRQANGKDPVGKLIVDFKMNGEGFDLIIKDDGAGIPAEKIYQKAVGNGVIDGSKEMSEQDKLQLIFLPNLSAKDDVSELSGRGVGMDVVKNNIQEIGGTILISSELGKGTEFILRFA